MRRDTSFFIFLNDKFVQFYAIIAELFNLKMSGIQGKIEVRRLITNFLLRRL